MFEKIKEFLKIEDFEKEFLAIKTRVEVLESKIESKIKEIEGDVEKTEPNEDKTKEAIKVEETKPVEEVAK